MNLNLYARVVEAQTHARLLGNSYHKLLQKMRPLQQKFIASLIRNKEWDLLMDLVRKFDTGDTDAGLHPCTVSFALSAQGYLLDWATHGGRKILDKETLIVLWEAPKEKS